MISHLVNSLYFFVLGLIYHYAVNTNFDIEYNSHSIIFTISTVCFVSILYVFSFNMNRKGIVYKTIENFLKTIYIYLYTTSSLLIGIQIPSYWVSDKFNNVSFFITLSLWFLSLILVLCIPKLLSKFKQNK